MKARIKETGEVIDFKGGSIEHGICTWIGSDNMINQRPMPPGGIEILEKNSDFNSIDWEQRRYEIAKETVTAIMSNEDFYHQVLCEGAEHGQRQIQTNIARAAVIFADALIEELKTEK